MTVKREFSCDLCKDSIADDNGGIGIRFTNKAIYTTIVRISERHLCSRCFQWLKNMVRDLDASLGDSVSRSEGE